MLEGFATWIGGGLSSAFFSSLEKSSCVGLSVTEGSDSECGDGEKLYDGEPRSDQSLAGTDLDPRDWSLLELAEFKSPRHRDLFRVGKFHHVEFWCADASNTWRRFSWGLGMNLVAKSDQSTGNQVYCSYVIQSNELVFAFTAPYSQQIDQSSTRLPHPGFNAGEANTFFDKHGLAVRAVGVLVDDAEEAFRIAVANGAVGILEPTVLTDEISGGRTKLAELTLFEDVVLRLVSTHGFSGPYLPNFEPVDSLPISYGIERLDHVVGNVPDLMRAAGYLRKFTGFHEVQNVLCEDIGSSESGLKSSILANDDETVVVHLNEPVPKKKGESQIQSFLQHNEGPGLQHLALVCEDIFSTVNEMSMHSHIGGFEFMSGPPPTYYRNLRKRVGGILSDEQCKQCEELGIMLCLDEHAVVLQAFTKSLGDRPTIFIEVIQRIARRQVSNGRLSPGTAKVNCSKLFEERYQFDRSKMKA